MSLPRSKGRALRLAGSFLLLSVLSLAPSASPAQTPSQRAALDSLRDSLALLTDSAALPAAMRQLRRASWPTYYATGRIELGRPGQSAMERLRMGLAFLRLARLRVRHATEAAMADFGEAARMKPDWPYAWWLRGEAELARGDTVNNTKNRLAAAFKSDPYRRASGFFQQALDVDPGFVPAAIGLVRAEGNPTLNDPRPNIILDAVREADTTDARKDPAFLLWWGRAEREFGNADSALLAFRLFVKEGGDPGLGLAEYKRALARRWLALDQDLAATRFARSIPAWAALYTLGPRSPDSATVQVAYAVPGNALEDWSESAAYRVRLRVVFSDANGVPVAILDTTHAFRVSSPPAGRILAWRDALQVPAERLAWRLAVQVGDSSGRLLAPELLDASPPQTLAIGALVLGLRSIGPGWVRAPDDTIWFNPTANFPAGATMTVDYVVLGLAPGTTYRTQLTVVRKVQKLFGRSEEAIRIGFEEQAAGATTRANRTLDLSRLTPGDYSLRVVIRDAAGQTVEREQEFTIGKG